MSIMMLLAALASWGGDMVDEVQAQIDDQCRLSMLVERQRKQIEAQSKSLSRMAKKAARGPGVVRDTVVVQVAAKPVVRKVVVRDTVKVAVVSQRDRNSLDRITEFQILTAKQKVRIRELEAAANKSKSNRWSQSTLVARLENLQKAFSEEVDALKECRIELARAKRYQRPP